MRPPPGTELLIIMQALHCSVPLHCTVRFRDFAVAAEPVDEKLRNTAIQECCQNLGDDLGGSLRVQCSPRRLRLQQTDMVCGRQYLHCESKKLGHFYFYCNFGKCGPISIILSLLDS